MEVLSPGYFLWTLMWPSLHLGINSDSLETNCLQNKRVISPASIACVEKEEFCFLGPALEKQNSGFYGGQAGRESQRDQAAYSLGSTEAELCPELIISCCVELLVLRLCSQRLRFTSSF